MKKVKFIVFGILMLFVALCLGCMIKYKLPPKEFAIKVRNKITAQISGKSVEIINEPEKIVVNEWTKGYSIAFPKDMTVDIKNSSEYIESYNENTKVIVTREWAPYDDVMWYIENYQNNYILNKEYQTENNINIVSDEKTSKFCKITLERNTDAKHKNNYTYYYVLSETGKQAFFRIMIKADDYDEETVNSIISSFKEIPIKGQTAKLKVHKRIRKKFSPETKRLYNDIIKTKKIKWGIFVDGAYTKDDEFKHMLNIEEDTNSKFEFSLHYINLDGNFPADEMLKMYDAGKITELTLQISNHYNSDLFGKNPNFDVYDGLSDENIRSLAKKAKAFGKPFLFRLNNEMNSDWVNYSGVAALSDPDIFKENWIRIYNIFKDEGADNALWIFNPNNEDCPPSHWNSYLAYYPGDEYVDLIGLTGYNTGTYYEKEFNEKWRSFDEIYEEPYDKLMQSFSDFPFIITEFSSSSVGGNKSEWIKNMFTSIEKYPNIKMALWWSSRDYDFRDKTYTIVARPYFLDETQETTDAFRIGMENYLKK